MPQYDFRCQRCRHRFTLRFKSVAAYDKALKRCPDCGLEDVSRVIKQVAIASSNRDYSKMTANEMLLVLEGGDKKQVDKLFKQVGETAPDSDSSSNDNALKDTNRARRREPRR